MEAAGRAWLAERFRKPGGNMILVGIVGECPVATEVLEVQYSLSCRPHRVVLVKGCRRQDGGAVLLV